MDGSDFDALTRTVAAPLSRRITLGGLAAGVLLALGLALDETSVHAKKKKGKGKGKKNKKNKKKKKNNCRAGSFRPVPCGDTCCAIDETCCGDSSSFFFCCASGDTCRPEGCIQHCNDREKNFDETDIDCGGSCRDLKKCRLAQSCAVDADCFNNVCVSRPDLRTDGNLCLLCRIDSDCDRLDPGNPGNFRCLNNLCSECAIDDDCPRPGQDDKQQFCVEPVAGGCPANTRCACRQCRDSNDCPTGQICDETNTCFGGCTDGELCTNENGDDRLCCDGMCGKPCTSNADCAGCPLGVGDCIEELGVCGS